MIDLTNKVTVFVVKAGYNPNYNECIKSLKNQDCKFLLKEIIDVKPMSAAFNQMIEQCSTEFYVQVDQDFVLKQNAISTLHNLITEYMRNSPKVTVFNCLLRDPHLDKNICGIKIYKHEILKKYPYNLDSNSCEKTQMNDFQKDGYELIFDPCNNVLGEHSPVWTKELIFERYYTLMGKAKEFQYTWLEKLPNYLKDKYEKQPTDINFYALMGAMSNIMKSSIGLDGEKNFNDLEKPECGLIKGWLESKPTLASFHVSPVCNLECNFCIRQTGEFVINHKQFDLDMVDRVLNKFPSINSVCLAGMGEPLLNPALGYIIQKLKTKGKFVGLITNGVLLGQKIKEFNAIYNGIPNYISVSLNSSNRDLYKKRTNKDYFDQVIEGIELTRKLLPNLDLQLTYVSSKENLSDIPAFLKLANDLNVSGVHLLNLLPHLGFNENDWFKDNVFTVNDNHLIDELKCLPYANKVLSYPTLIDFNETKRNCKFAWTSISVDGDGSISPCLCVDPCDSKNGNINDGIVFNNLAYLNLRDSLLGEQREQCKVCFRNFANT